MSDFIVKAQEIAMQIQSTALIIASFTVSRYFLYFPECIEYISVVGTLHTSLLLGLNLPTILHTHRILFGQFLILKKSVNDHIREFPESGEAGLVHGVHVFGVCPPDLAGYNQLNSLRASS